jgi:hypothetical protein
LLYSSRICGLKRGAQISASRRPFGVTLCQLIQLSKSFGLGFRFGAPFPMERSNIEPNNKKPGVERRANSSTQIGRICAMLD